MRYPKIERKIEFLDLPLRGGEIKEYNDQKGTIGGYANYKNNLDYTDDITRDGAFRKTIQDAFSRKAAQHLDYLYPYLWSHDWHQIPPGGVYDADEDKKGFYTRTQFNLDLQSGRDLYYSFKNRTLSKQSIGYRCIQSNFEKDAATGRTVRNLLEIAVQEISAVVFPANDLATVDTVKSRGIYNTMLNSPDWKDFSTNYQQRQVDDWANDDFYDLTSALQASITDCFGSGMDAMAELESDVIPGFLAALRAYVQEGVSLGYSTAPSSAADVYMMSMASAGQEGKAGYLSASNHAVLKEASMNIMKHARAVAKVSDALEASRRNALQGYPIARSTSSAAMTYFEQKEAEEEQHSVLKRLADELEISNNMRELRKLSSELGELQLKQVTANKRG